MLGVKCVAGYLVREVAESARLWMMRAAFLFQILSAPVLSLIPPPVTFTSFSLRFGQIPAVSCPVYSVTLYLINFEEYPLNFLFHLLELLFIFQIYPDCFWWHLLSFFILFCLFKMPIFISLKCLKRLTTFLCDPYATIPLSEVPAGRWLMLLFDVPSDSYS